MQLIRKTAIVATTFLLAAATGHYMQGTAQKPARMADKADAAPVPAPKPLRNAALPVPGKVTPLSAAAATGDKSIAAPAPRDARPGISMLKAALPAAQGAVSTAPAVASASPSCHPATHLTVDPGAILHLRLDAPCHADQRVVLRHGGLAFTELTDAKGKLDIRLPAMTEQAKVTVMFPGDSTVSASTLVPELSLYDRVAVQWVGKDRFDLHALEFGARFGEEGDISAGNPGTPAPSTQAVAGFLMTLGNGKVSLPMKAQVYSFPTRLSAQGGKIRLVIDADVSADTCGREMLAETLRTRRDADPAVKDLSVAMPGCDAPGGEGGFVQLSGLMPDIRIAED